MKKDEKTNVARFLEKAGIPYTYYTYEVGDTVPGGMEIARLIGLEPDRVFKTLVTEGASREHYVFVIPVTGELDLKKAARAVGEKSIAMLRSKDLLPLTGYIHGGCSPLGMKKPFRTVFDETAELFEQISFSAGKVGCSVELSPEDLKAVLDYETADLTVG